MILKMAIIFFITFLVLLTVATLKTSVMRERACKRVEKEMEEDEIKGWPIKKEEKPMKEEQIRPREGVLRVARPVNMAGVIYGVIVGLVLLFGGIYLWTPSQIREYRVQMEKGVYQIRGVVQYGFDFTAYQSVDGKEAILICGELNADLMRDRGGVLRNGKVA